MNGSYQNVVYAPSLTLSFALFFRSISQYDFYLSSSGILTNLNFLSRFYWFLPFPENIIYLFREKGQQGALIRKSTLHERFDL